MTRRLGGGIGLRSLAAFASFSLAATLAGGFAIIGCGGDSNPDGGTGDDGGDGAAIEASVKMDATSDGFDGFVPKPEAGPDVVDAGNAPEAEAGPIIMACVAPTFMPNGGSITSGSVVTIVPPAGFPTTGNIFYTTDNTMPTHASKIYNGPIQVTAGETIRAIAYAMGAPTGNCSDSPMAMATFTVTPGDGGLTAPIFNPPSVTQNNDFTLSLSSPGATICYTLDGVTVPTCNTTTGVCTNSTTYNSGTGISINGTVTNATTGQVTVQAIACVAGSNATGVIMQTYGLKAAAPTFQAPSPATIAYTTAGANPTVSTTTISSTTSSTTNVPFIRYTTDGSTPTCLVGTMLNGMAGGNSGTVNVLTSTSYNAIACKNGYAPSTVTLNQAYVVQLNAPVIGVAGGTYYDVVAPGLALTSATVVNPGAGASYVCYSTTGAATCGTAGACGTGSTAGTPASISATGTVLNAITCPLVPANYLMSSGIAPQTYTLQLRNIIFAPPAGTLVPVAGGLMVAISENNAAPAAGPGGRNWKMLCYTIDGVTMPDCTCTGTNQNMVTAVPGTPGNAWASPTIPSTTTSDTIYAVGCDTGDTTGTFLQTAITAANYPNAGTMAAPTILPATPPALNNDTTITFTNNDTTSPGKICYTSDGTTAPTCTAGGAITCTASVAVGATSTTGPVVSVTGTKVQAIACDTSVAGKMASAIVPLTYVVQAAQPMITPGSGTVYVGQTITFTSTTASSAGRPVTFYYTTNGTPATCGSGVCSGIGCVTSGVGTSASGTYSITGLETGPLQAVACRNGYTQSVPTTATYAGFTAQQPVFAYGTAPYDDYLTVGVQATSLATDTSYWLCYSINSAGPACGAAANSCSSGTPIAHAALSAANCTASPNAPNAVTGLCGLPPVVNATGSVLTAVSCSQPGAAVYQSAATTATYTLNASSVVYSPSTGGAQPGAIPTVTMGLVPSTLPPNGNPTTPTNGVTSTATQCWSTVNTVVPATCPPNLAGTPAGWTCQYGNSAAFTIATNLAANTTYNSFVCKAGLNPSSLASITYTFSAYSHTITFTGIPADFTAPAEKITAGSGAAYVSWDSMFLYVGFDSAALGHNQYIHFYIGGQSGGTSTADTVTSGVPDPAIPPPNSQFHIFVTTSNAGPTAGNVISQGADVFGAGGWTAQAGVLQPVVHNAGSTFYEFKVTLAPLGLTTLRLAGDGWDPFFFGSRFGIWPGPTALTSYQNETLSSAKNPNDPTNVVP